MYYYTQQPGATAKHHPPCRSSCSMILRINFVSQLEFAVSAGTDIVAIERWLCTGGEVDQHPSQLVTRSMNLHAQPHLISQNSPTCTLTSMNFCSSGFCSSVINDCSRKPKASLPALVEPLTLPVHSGYMARTTDHNKFRDDEFYTVINLSHYSPSYSYLRVSYLG